MALRERLRMDAEVVGRAARKGVVAALRQVAEALREERPLEIGPAAVEAPAPTPSVAPAPASLPASTATPAPIAAPVAAPPAVAAAPVPSDAAVIYDRVIDAIHTIFDPEIPVDIYELGLIYGVEVRDDASVNVRMTLTSPNCPAAQSLPSEVEEKVGAIDGVRAVDVEVVFEPPWTPDLMSEEAKLELNLM